jgi:hypothetical protein
MPIFNTMTFAPARMRGRARSIFALPGLKLQARAGLRSKARSREAAAAKPSVDQKVFLAFQPDHGLGLAG